MSGENLWFQVEFYSDSEGRWVPLFARERTQNEAERKARDWLPNTRSRVTCVKQVTEVVWEMRDGVRENSR